jgi:hypothetical protein
LKILVVLEEACRVEVELKDEIEEKKRNYQGNGVSRVDLRRLGTCDGNVVSALGRSCGWIERFGGERAKAR